MGELNTISALYDKLVYAGIVFDDPGQKGAIKALDALYIEVNPSFNLKNIFSENKNMGVYIYGSVGRGKSYIMDIFFKLFLDCILLLSDIGV